MQDHQCTFRHDKCFGDGGAITTVNDVNCELNGFLQQTQKGRPKGGKGMFPTLAAYIYNTKQQIKIS